MLRADTGNFNRLLASLGVGLLIAAAVIPYFFFRDTGVLLIPRRQLFGLTRTAREAIEARQHVLSDLEIGIAMLSGLLLVGGIVLLVVSARRLLVIQGKEDEKLELTTKREGVELQQLNPDELNAKRDEEAKEATVEPASEQADLVAPTTPSIPDMQETTSSRAPSPVQEVRPAETADERYRRNRAAIVRIEETVVRTLKPARFRNYRYLADVKVVDEGERQQVNLDGLFRALADGRDDVVLLLKIAPSRQLGVRRRIREYTETLLATIVRYEAITGRSASGWLALVQPDDFESTDFDPEVIQRTLEGELSGLARSSLIKEAELGQSLPSLFEAFYDKDL